MPRRLTRHDPATEERATKRFELVVTPTEYEAWSTAATADQRSLAQWIRLACAEKLERLGLKKKTIRPTKKK